MKRKKLCLQLAIILILNIFVIGLAQEVDAATYGRGDRNDMVRQIQMKMKELGVYTGSTDGNFGPATEEAVKKFQESQGLTVDGRVGAKTMEALGISVGDATQSGQSDLDLLARLISAEARGEPYVGQVAVGAVVLNRMAHPSFPNTMSGVIYQPHAFTCLYDGQFDEPIAESAYQAARDAMNGNDPSNGAIYYFNPVTATSEWIWSRPLILQIGKHRFCS